MMKRDLDFIYRKISYMVVGFMFGKFILGAPQGEG